MTLKQRFANRYRKATSSQRKHYSLNEIRNQAPVTYSADEVMQGVPTKRCDYFVFCDCAPSTTGIYMVEVKGASPSISKVREQLQGGSDFISCHMKQNDQFDFLPVVVAKAIPNSARSTFQKVGIHLRGETRYIKHIRPKAPLEKLTSRQD